MPRPDFGTLAPGTAGWDTFINDLVLGLTKAPFPILVEPDLATLTANFDAAQYEDCIALVQTPTRALHVSDGATWSPL